jgi:Trk-type K+ transport system membrane component
MMRGMTHKPHHQRHRRFSEHNQVLFITGFVLVIVLALLGLFLWWTNNPKLGSP